MYHAVSAPASLGTRKATAPISASARRVRAVRAAVSEPPPTSPSASPFVPRWNLSRAPLGPGVEPAPGGPAALRPRTYCVLWTKTLYSLPFPCNLYPRPRTLYPIPYTLRPIQIPHTTVI